MDKKNIKEVSIPVGESTLILQFNRFAKKSDLSVFARMGDTCVLVTLVIGKDRQDMDYFPLYIDYVEKFYAGGKIKGSRWVKREGKPSEDAVLTRRLIDRGIRPLFPKGFKREVQIIITILSLDGENSPEIASAIAASTLLQMSRAPWNGPISTIRVGYIPADGDKKGNLVLNPNEEVQDYSALDLIVTSGKDRVGMIEAKANIVPDEVVLEGIDLAVKENAKIVTAIKDAAKKYGVAKESAPVNQEEEELKNLLKKSYADSIPKILEAKSNDNLDDKELTDELIDTVYDDESGKYEKGQIANAIFALIRDKIRSGVLKDGKRFDGRGLEDIRELYAEVSVLPRTHGSALFRRGMTEVMSIATLGSSTLEQLIEGPEGQEAKRYIHHYYSPPYSYGEVGRVGWPSPREIGHGALAEKALIPVLPSKEEFPYVIRIVSEILSSNGSTSMAATCGSTLSLMDTGVPITSPVAGVSVGLMWESDDNYKLLTDIAGVEDFTGDMDFKIAGTADGITVIQLDVKIEGVTLKVVQETFEQSKRGRLKILEMMHGVIAAPRKSVSKYAPKIVVLAPPEDKVGEIIGPGGKNIRAIIAQTNTDINVDNDNKVSVSGINQAEVDKAVELIENIYRSVEIGEEFDAEVKRLMPFGAFVEFLPGKEGLIHVSQMGKGFVKDPADVVKEGDKIRVKVIKVDDRGKVGLSLLR